MTSRMLVGLIGTNIQKSLAPALHEDAFAAAGVSGHYHLMDVQTLPGRKLEDLLALFLNGLQYRKIAVQDY